MPNRPMPMPMPMPTSIKRSDSAQVFLLILYVDVVFITLIRVGWRASRSLGMAHGNGVSLSLERQLRERVIYRKICLSSNRQQAAGSSKRSFRGLRQKSISGIATKKSKGVNPLHYIQSCIESFRLNRSAPQLIPAWCGPIPVVCFTP